MRKLTLCDGHLPTRTGPDPGVRAVSNMSPRTETMREDERGQERTADRVATSTAPTVCDHNLHAVSYLLK